MSNKDIPWPPKSPADVIALTPTKHRLAPDSPSPLRTVTRTPRPPRSPTLGLRSARKARGGVLGGGLGLSLDGNNDDDDYDDDGIDGLNLDSSDDDEETLKLKLARIEAKLKLKHLQKKRKRADSITEAYPAEAAAPPAAAAGVAIGPVPGFKSTTATTATGTQAHIRSKNDVTGTEQPRPRLTRATTPVAQIQVAGSPEKKPPPSPSRVLLGIDKGLRAKDISLKRAPNLKYPPIAGVTRASTTSASTRVGAVYSADPFSSRPFSGGNPPNTNTASERNPSPTRPVVKTFNQRIAEARAAENEKKAKLAAIEKSRSKGFGLSEEELAAAASEMAVDATISSLEMAPRPSIWATSTSASASTSTSTSRPSTNQSFPAAALFDPPRPTSTAITNNDQSSSSSSTASGYDSFSQLHLSHRTLPHTTLSRALSQKTIFLLPDLLKIVVSPAYEPPNIEGDWVVMGIICSKSEPRQTTKSTNSTNSNKSSDPDGGGGDAGGGGGGDKYMVFSLTDLKWDIELFLFGSGFHRFWKISIGTVVAILNPGIMRPRNADSGKFALTISSSDDTVLEIGQARDLGFCKSIKRDGKNCSSWVDKRRMEHCSFHVELAVKRNANQRMELNNMGKLFSPPRKGKMRPRSTFLHRRGGGEISGAGRDDGLLHEGPLPDLPQRLGGAGGKVFILPSRSTNALFDDSFADAFHMGTRDERMKKQLARGEKEREVARRLVATQKRVGGGTLSTGAEYLRRSLEEEERRREKDKKEKDSAAGGVGGGLPSTESSSTSLFRTRLPRNNEDYTSLLSQNRTTTSADINLSSIKRRRPLPPSKNPTASRPLPPIPTRLKDDQPEKKKAKTVHFMRPVVTGGEILSGGTEGLGGGGDNNDEDDDLEIC